MRPARRARRRAGAGPLVRRDLVGVHRARRLRGRRAHLADLPAAHPAARGASGRTELVDQMGNGLGFEDAIEKIVAADPEHESILRALGGKGSGSGTDNAKSQSEPKTQKLTPLEMIAQGLSTLK